MKEMNYEETMEFRAWQGKLQHELYKSGIINVREMFQMLKGGRKLYEDGWTPEQAAEMRLSQG